MQKVLVTVEFIKPALVNADEFFSELYSNHLSEGVTGVVRVTWPLNHNTQFYRVLGIGQVGKQV